MRNLFFALILAIGLFLPFAQPVQADTQLLGVTSIGYSTAPSQLFYSKFAATGSGTITAIKVYVFSAVNIKVGIYSDNVGVPDTLLAASNVGTSVTTGAWRTVMLTTSCSVTSGTNYWLAFNASSSSACGYGTASSSRYYYQTLAYVNDMPVVAAATQGGLYTAFNLQGWTVPIIPVVTTQSASLLTTTTATGNGTVVTNSGSTITEKGICYMAGSSGDPTTGSSTSHDHVDSVGAYAESIAGLTKGTAYRLRAYAINGLGTGYGTTVDMTTIGDPTILTIDASNITNETARINAQVTFDGGEPCSVTFVYFAGSPYADYAAIVAAGGTEVVAVGTYTTGQSPYYNLSGLTIGTLYSFAVKIVNSTATTAYGSVLTFTTETGIADTSGFTAIPTSTTISLAWVKGLGSQYTLVRYSDSAYPAAVTDGVLGYLNTGNSVTLTGLTSGTTYYFSAWGKTSGLYSATPVNAIATTLAYDAAPTSTTSLVTPTPDSTWTQTPSSVKTSTIPLFGTAIAGVATAYNQPVNYVWYFAWILAAVGAAIVVYIKGQYNFVLSLSVMVGIIGIGVWWYNMVPGLIVVVISVIGIGWALVGFRRPGT